MLGIVGISCSAKDRSFVDVNDLGGSGGSAPTTGGTENLGGEPPMAGAPSTGGTSKGGTSAGGTSGSSVGGAPLGGEPPVGGEAGMAGAGGVPIIPPDPGAPGFGLVVGGVVMSSKNFTLLSTTGEAPGGQQVMSSTNFTLASGLVGTTQTQ